MSRRKRWSGSPRAFFAILVVAVLATSTWAAISQNPSAVSPAVANLEAPIPPPEEVFIQQRSNSDGLGNVFVLVQLSAADVDAKKQDGTVDFITLGTSESTVILRDDGDGGDVAAGDRLYTGIASVDVSELQNRAAEDQKTLSANAGRLIPLFTGRTASGVAAPAAFDFAGFSAGQRVRIGPAVAFVQPEGIKPPPITFANPVVAGTNAFQEKVLMITDTDVTADTTRVWNPCNNTGNPNGVWTFNHLMTQMANQPATGINPADFVQDWLDNWTVSHNINSDPIPARNAMQDIIDEWPLAGGKLDLTKSPLRLLAIVPRVDLRLTTGGGGGYSGGSGDFLDGGELRFIFGFVAKAVNGFDPTQAFNGAVQINNSTCYALPFTVIFEYKVPKVGCTNVRTWAQQWVALNALTPSPGNTPYNNQLAALTQQVVMANTSPGSFNGSSLKQLRTNEVALDAPWELREFRLLSNTFPVAFLEPNAVDDTIRNDPASDFNEDANSTGLLADWIQLVVKPALITAGNFEAPIPPVPPTYQGQPFRAGDSRTVEPDPRYITFHWGDQSNLTVDPNIDLAENWARHRVSRAGCNGCHGRDTFTHFVHVNPADTIILSTWDTPSSNWTPLVGGNPVVASPTLPAELSLFLTGINQLGDPADAVANTLDVRSPFDGNPKRNFDDLARRELDIQNVAGVSCGSMVQVDRAHVLRSLQETGRLPHDLFQETSLDKRRSVAINDIKRNRITEVH